MWRELAQIAIAIQLSGPHLSTRNVNRFAPVIQSEAEIHNLDPFVWITYIARESQWNERVISHDGLDFGLGQVRAMLHGNHTSSLLVGEYNIRSMTSVIVDGRRICTDWLGREPEFQEYTRCYIGGCGTANKMCKPNRATTAEENYFNCLHSQVIRNVCEEDCQQIFIHQEPRRNHR